MNVYVEHYLSWMPHHPPPVPVNTAQSASGGLSGNETHPAAQRL